jgi:2-phosphoglycerate kinase
VLPSELRTRLRHVYWIGGGSGAGKSTTARRLAARYGLTVYSTDDVMAGHGRRITAHDAPYLTAFAAMDMDERWVSRSPEAMLATFGWYRGEGFDLIVADLLQLPAGTAVIAEGFRLLPDLVKPLLAETHRAVWLLPTPRFREAALTSRGTIARISGRTGDPERALRNVLARDQMFTDRLVEQTHRLDLPAITVDTTMTEDELTERVARAFGL